MTELMAARAAARRGGRGRLLGIDAARALALLGMMAVHILPSEAPDGSANWYYTIAGGRSSALFAVLAGVGLALASGGSIVPSGTALKAARRGTLARAGLLAAIGLILGGLDSGVAVILVHYGVLFVFGALFLGMSRGWLWALAGVWAVVAPVLSHMVRSAFGDPGGLVPNLGDLARPGHLLVDLMLTGYYPVFTWVSYLLAGLAIGRSQLRSPRQAWALLAGGAGVAIGARAGSAFLLREAGIGPLPVQFFGTTPTDSWSYLAVATPHSGSTFDLLHTAGSAAAVVGLCLLLGAAASWSVAWLAGAGGMTLTLYTAHVMALATRLGVDNRPRLFAIHAGAALILAALWRLTVGRGPLETVAANFAAVARSTVPSLPERSDRLP